MKANEFVKKFGWGEAKALIAKHEKSFMPRVFDMWSDELQDFVLAEKYASFDMDDLKRLVESHELVEKVGGLLSAKANINEMVVDSGSGYVSDGAKLYDYDFSFGSLRKAIADVESCMEGDK